MAWKVGKNEHEHELFCTGIWNSSHRQKVERVIAKGVYIEWHNGRTDEWEALYV